MNRGFKSGLAIDLDNMITLNVSLNRSESTYMDRAKNLDDFCYENYSSAEVLTEAIVFNWLRTSLRESPEIIHRKVSFARTFGKYQRAIGKQAYVLHKDFTCGRNIFVPYLFSDKELTNLFNEIDLYEKKSNPFEGMLLSVYFRLTFTCGLRPHEGRLLKRADLDLTTGEIRIVNSKWHRSRTVVMSDDMFMLMKKYVAIRDGKFTDSEYLFPRTNGGPYTANCLGNRFKRLFALSCPDIPKELLPSVRVYDLRHRFATTSLNRWLDQGVDIKSRLPYLQTYMGHKDLNATAYYIHLLPENLVKSAGIDWESLNDLIPEVELWAK